jgi:type IV pilus assembly protein PilN
MIRINLLPYREKEKKENLKKQITIIAGSFIFFSLVLVYIQMVVTSSINTLEEKITERDKKLVVLKKTLGDIEGFKRNIKELELKLAIIKGLEGNRFLPVRMLDEISTMVPVQDMWLEKLTQTGTDLRVEGVARNNIIVARFMKNLEYSSIVSSVSLVSTMQKEIAGFPLLQFTLSCTLRKG